MQGSRDFYSLSLKEPAARVPKPGAKDDGKFVAESVFRLRGPAPCGREYRIRAAVPGE